MCRAIQYRPRRDFHETADYPLYVEALTPKSLLLTSPLAPTKRIMSLKEPHLKMSKSHQDPRSRIHINDAADAISDKIRLALTDSLTGVSFDPVNRPGVSNLLSIMSSLDVKRRTAEEIAQACNDMSMKDFKVQASSTISKGLSSAREHYNRLIDTNNADYLDEVAANGCIEARKQAKITISIVRQAIGL